MAVKETPKLNYDYTTQMTNMHIEYSIYPFVALIIYSPRTALTAFSLKLPFLPGASWFLSWVRPMDNL